MWRDIETNSPLWKTQSGWDSHSALHSPPQEARQREHSRPTESRMSHKIPAFATNLLKRHSQNGQTGLLMASASGGPEARSGGSDCHRAHRSPPKSGQNIANSRRRLLSPESLMPVNDRELVAQASQEFPGTIRRKAKGNGALGKNLENNGRVHRG